MLLKLSVSYARRTSSTGRTALTGPQSSSGRASASGVGGRAHGSKPGRALQIQGSILGPDVIKNCNLCCHFTVSTADRVLSKLITNLVKDSLLLIKWYD